MKDLLVTAEGNKRLEDGSRLSSYSGVSNGCTLLLVVLIPFDIYVKGIDGQMHTITIPSSEPDVSSLSLSLSLPPSLPSFPCPYNKIVHSQCE